ncbi:MAG: DUF3102 domain-containing protein [Clostridia bacterium]|nr:DUF3102 domain-containing protein [Clostridia bacterium]
MSTEISVAVRRAVIETNLEQCRDAAARNLVEIGRWLNAAKDEGIVPHGEWTGWVQRHAGMNERTAQRCMQAARELPAGSTLEGLGMAKIRALLTLPAGEREEVAARIDAGRATSREVQEAVRAARAERDEALRVVGAQKEQIALLRDRRDDAVKAAVADAKRAESEQRAKTKAAQQRVQALEQGQKNLGRLLGEAEEKNEKLRAELERALREKERQIDELTDQLDDAQTALARGAMTGDVQSSPETRILSAIGALMAQAGRAPGELARLASPPDRETRQLLIGQARMVGQWCMQVIAACGGETDGGI